MSIEFSQKLIKGRIAEVVFEQMIRDEGKYTVIPFGYEHTMPALAQYRGHAEIEGVIDNIADAPDFALVSKEETPEGKVKIYFVEVRYQSEFNVDQIKKDAVELLNRWKYSWLFIATRHGFYCTPCNELSKGSEPWKLPESWVKRDCQSKYLDLLKEFEPEK